MITSHIGLFRFRKLQTICRTKNVRREMNIHFGFTNDLDKEHKLY